MRFVFLSNFTGHPAISVPVGLSTQGKLLHLLVTSSVQSVVSVSSCLRVEFCNHVVTSESMSKHKKE